MFVEIDLEALARALVLPVSDGVTHAVEKRTPPEINPADEQTAKMADVADVAAAQAKSSQELEHYHEDHESAHAHRDCEHEPDLAVREENGTSQQDSEDRT